MPKITQNYNNPKAHKILLDLAEKYPKGQFRRLKKEHYVVKRQWSDVYMRDVPVTFVSDGTPTWYCDPAHREFYGYNPLDVYLMGVDSEDVAVAAYRSLPGSSELSSTSIRRRARLAWTRIVRAINHIREEGTEGLWEVNFREADWGTPLAKGFYFHGKTRSEIEARIMVIAPMLGAQPHWRPRINFQHPGTPDEAMVENSTRLNSVTSGIDRSIKGHEKEIEKLRRSIEQASEFNGRIMSALMLDSTPASEATDDEEEVP